MVLLSAHNMFWSRNKKTYFQLHTLIPGLRVSRLLKSGPISNQFKKQHKDLPVKLDLQWEGRPLQPSSMRFWVWGSHLLHNPAGPGPPHQQCCHHLCRYLLSGVSLQKKKSKFNPCHAEYFCTTLLLNFCHVNLLHSSF